MAKLVFLLVCISAVTWARPNPGEQYTTKYDNVDFEKILKSDRLLTNYVNCLMEKGRCTPEGQELKAHLPDALQTGCSKCSDTQKKVGYKIVDFIIDNKPETWTMLQTKYDPEGTYITTYKTELENRKEAANSEK